MRQLAAAALFALLAIAPVLAAENRVHDEAAREHAGVAVTRMMLALQTPEMAERLESLRSTPDAATAALRQAAEGKVSPVDINTVNLTGSTWFAQPGSLDDGTPTAGGVIDVNGVDIYFFCIGRNLAAACSRPGRRALTGYILPGDGIEVDEYVNLVVVTRVVK